MWILRLRTTLCKHRTSIKIKKRNEVFIGSKHENYYLVGVTNLCWQGEQTFGWGVYWEIIFPGGGMKKFPAGGRWGGGGTPPKHSSRKNPVDWVWKTRSAHFASGVADFMQNLSSPLISLVMTSTSRPWL